jgi:hypothetical protein
MKAINAALLTDDELADIERFQKQRRQHPVPEDAWLYVAEIDRLLAYIRQCGERDLAAQPPSLVVRQVLSRRAEQDFRWGGAEHDDEHDEFDWQEFITKQVTEAAAADDSVIWRERMLDIAALAVAALEWADRRDAEL